MQIVDRVGGQTQLGKNQQIDMRIVRAARFCQNRIAIKGDIGGPHMRRRSRHPHKAVFVQGKEGMATIGLGRCAHDFSLTQMGAGWQ